jgi:ribosome biogenesis GTPase
VVPVNAKDRDSVAALDAWLPPGTTAVLVGSSGAGKSTLTNTLLGIDRMKTAEVRESDARGRHTTTHRALIPLPSGACLIDTPGMRELKPTGEEDVAENFSDIDALSGQCKFRDCGHEREPGCAVRAAIDGGTLDTSRYAHYIKLRDEVAGAADKLATRLAQQSADKTTGKPVGKRSDEKYGRY